MKRFFKNSLLLAAGLSAASSAWAQQAKTVPANQAYTIKSENAAQSPFPVSYQWYRNDVAIANATDSSYTVPAGNANGSNVRFKRKATAVECTVGNEAFTNVITLTFQNIGIAPCEIPATPAITSSGNACTGATMTYSVTPVANVTYHWTTPSTWELLSGQNTSSITAKVGTTGAVGVMLTNDCGSSSAQVGVNVLNQHFDITGPTMILANQSNLAFRASNLAGTKFGWSFPSGWTCTQGCSDSAYTAIATAGATSGMVSMTPTNATCGLGDPATLYVEITTPSTAVCADGLGTYLAGLCWANANVGAPRTFADVDYYSPYYQWNRDYAYPADDGSHNLTISDFPAADLAMEWSSASNPCPTGWRLPSSSEYSNLIGLGYTWAEANTKGNRVWGMFFGINHSTCTLNKMAGCVFLPALGGFYDTSSLQYPYHGFYWTSDSEMSNYAYFLNFNYTTNNTTATNGTGKNNVLTIRCVQ